MHPYIHSTVETVYTGCIVKKEQRGISFKGKDCNKIEFSYFDLSVLSIFSFDSNMLQNSQCDTELYSHRNMYRKKKSGQAAPPDSSQFNEVALSKVCILKVNSKNLSH